MEVSQWVDGTPIYVLPCAVDLERFRPVSLAREKLRRELGRNGTVFVYVGKAGGWYDVEGMVDFLAAARAVFRPLTLLVLTTEDPSVFSELYEAAGIELIIRRAEPHEVPDYLSAADVGLCFRHRFPSQLSCSPIKLAEYLACGLPVVATSGCGDYDELIEAEDVGVVIQNGDEETVVAAAHELQALLREPTIGQRCRSTAERFLGLEEVVVPRYSEIYQCLCSA